MTSKRAIYSFGVMTLAACILTTGEASSISWSRSNIGDQASQQLLISESPGSSFQDLRYGFKGVRWGATADEFQKARPEAEVLTGGFRVKNDNIAGYQALATIYHFVTKEQKEEKFRGMVILYQIEDKEGKRDEKRSREIGERILVDLTRIYGRPNRPAGWYLNGLTISLNLKYHWLVVSGTVDGISVFENTLGE